MSSAQALAEFGQGTAITGKAALGFTVDAPVSGLLEETRADKPFATFFGETRFYSDNLRALAGAWGIEMEAWGTPVLHGEVVRRGAVVRSREELRDELREEPVARSNADRITLLARKYVAKETFSDEENARLAIVTERVRQLMPAATVRDFETVEEVLKLTRHIAESDAGLRAVLGLPAPKNG